MQAILSGHKQATLERLQTQDVVLLVQDTTFLDYGTTTPKAGMGTVKVKKRQEYLLHPPVAFTPARVNFGVVGARWWQRPEQPVAQARKRKPIEEKERYRWLAGYTLACEVKPTCPATLVVNVADREGDIHEWFVDALRRLPGARAAFLLRAKCHRRLVKGKAQRYLGTEMREAPPLGRRTFALARPPERPPRPLTVTVPAKQVTVHQARRPGGPLPPVEVAAIYGQEGAPPPGEEAVEGRRLTSLPVLAFARACTVVKWYRCRWEIALFFRVRKQGCQIEPLRLQTVPRLLNAIAIYRIIA
jgi:hypothetical protein